MGYNRFLFNKRHNEFMTKNSGVCLGFKGGYYFDSQKQRYIRLYSSSCKRIGKKLQNKQFRHNINLNLRKSFDDELLDKAKDKVCDIWNIY